MTPWAWWPYALGALLLAVSGAVVLGLPLAADAIARRVPQQAEAAIGDQALEAPEGKSCTPSRLVPRMQEALQREFARLAAGLADGYRYRLLVRSCPGIGPNAFGVPGGAIVLTDQLVLLGRNMQEVTALLAHELGHVRERHGLRTLLKRAGPVALLRTLAGDAAAVTELATTLPAILLAGGYPREFEDEADAFALQRLRQLGISPRAYADMLERIEGKRAVKSGEATRDYFETHPLGGRIAHALAAETDLDRCTYAGADRESRLEACSKAIDSGKFSATELAGAYGTRGHLLYSTGALDRAIEDLGRALSLGSREPQA